MGLARFTRTNLVTAKVKVEEKKVTFARAMEFAESIAIDEMRACGGTYRSHNHVKDGVEFFDFIIADRFKHDVRRVSLQFED